MTNPPPPAETTATREPEIMDMAALLDEVGVAEPRTLRRGEVVEGRIMSVERDGVLVDIGSKSEGVVPTHEMHSLGADPLSKLAVDEHILVFVMQPETEEGQVLLSIDRARGEQGWRVLQDRFESGDIFEAEVTGFNKGGLLANVEGVNAFIPMSQVVGAKPGADASNPLSAQVSRVLRLKVIEINRRRNRVILSERAALQEYRAEQKERLLDELTEGEIRTGTVTSIRNFGVFVDLGGADGLVHLSELSWDRNANPEEMFRPGDQVQVYVMRVDRENKKIALSIRRAAPEQWEELITQYQVGDVVPAVITKLVAFGAFARLPGPVEGLVHVSELVDRRIGHPQEVVEEGDLVPLKIVRIEHDRHRLGLSLNEARREGELRGWEFDQAGRVVGLPDDAREKFPSEAAAAESRFAARRAQAAEAPPMGIDSERDEDRDGGAPREAAPAATREREQAPLTAMAAAMQQAQAELEARDNEAGGEPDGPAAVLEAESVEAHDAEPAAVEAEPLADEAETTSAALETETEAEPPSAALETETEAEPPSAALETETEAEPPSAETEAEAPSAETEVASEEHPEKDPE